MWMSGLLLVCLSFGVSACVFICIHYHPLLSFTTMCKDASTYLIKYLAVRCACLPEVFIPDLQVPDGGSMSMYDIA